ncbi:MAG: hypothetical protein PVH36_03495 [Desulfobacterales bacterium]|jgi:hypothetical protein
MKVIDENKGNKTDEKTESERDSMGRFVKGCPGGPGRGKKADFPCGQDKYNVDG